MGNVNEKVEAASSEIIPKNPPAEPPKKLKPCCACPETKRVRDQCVICQKPSEFFDIVSEFAAVSKGLIAAGEENWTVVKEDMELEPSKECTPREGGCVEYESNSEENMVSDKENNIADISVADAYVRSLLRERFLKLLSKLPGHQCTVNLFDVTTETCTVRAFEPTFENIIVEQLTTKVATVPRAILRVGDIKSMHFEIDDDLFF